ncbi:MAG: response regulator transcription factor [Actinomycetota bacterium]
MPLTRVLIAHTSDLVREGLRAILEAHGEELLVCGAAATPSVLLDLVVSLRPDVVLLDSSVDDGGTEIYDSLTRVSGAAVLVLADCHREMQLMGYFHRGASGVLGISSAPSEIVRAILQVRHGGISLGQQAASTLIGLLERVGTLLRDPRLARLTPTQELILKLVAEGETSAKIASRLGLAEKTIRNYLSRIYGKLQVNGRVSAVAYLERNDKSHFELKARAHTSRVG